MKFCIVLLTGLGDVVNGLPIANAIKRAWPDAHITWVTEPMPAGILQFHPSIDDIIVFHKKLGAQGVKRLRRDMKRREFDVAINLNIYFKSAWPMLFSGAPRRIGFERGRARDGVWLTANEHLAAGPRRHTLDMFLEFLAALGVAGGPVEWRIPITASEQREQEAFFKPMRDRPVVGVVTASANAKKDWPADRYPQLVDGLVERHNAHVVLLGGPGEREQSIARAVAAQAQHAPVWGLGDSIRRLTWLIAGCDLVIAPDTGPVHIARALDVPVIGLYGHTNPWRVGPYQKYQELWIDKYTDGPPDPSNFEPKHGRMEQITVDEVLTKAGLALPG